MTVFSSISVPQSPETWNTAEHAEKRHNARVAREYQVSLPAELNAGQRIALARAFSRHLAERYKVAVDLAVHEPRPGGDPRNFHAHMLTTTREVTPAGLGAKAGLDLQALERRRRVARSPQEYLICGTVGKARQRGMREERRCVRRPSQSRRPGIIGSGTDNSTHAAEDGTACVRSELAERLRAEYRERVQRRVERSPARSPLESAPQVAGARAAEGGDKGPHSPAQIQDVEEIRRQAREAWLRLRPKEAERAGAEHTAGERETFQPSKQAEDDLAR